MPVEETPLQKFEDFFRHVYKSKLNKVARDYPNQKSLFVTYADLEKYDPDLADELLEKPDLYVEHAEQAIQNIKLPIDVDDWKIHFRLFGLPESREIWARNLRSIHLGKMLAVEGLVRTASDVRPQALRIHYECPACLEAEGFWQDQDSVFVSEPFACPNCGRKGRFKVLGREFVDTTEIRLQELPAALLGSEQPSVLKVELRDDLVSPDEKRKILPGNEVCVTGILRERQIKTTSNKFEIYLDAVNVEARQMAYEEIELTDADIKEIEKVAADADVYSKLIESIAPTIYGYSDIKEAILLQLFGGTTKEQPDGSRIRGDIHILLVGDPGTGKSQMMRYVANLAPKGQYVSGKGASAAGLTAAAIKDEVTGGWMLEAGALVLANMGVACVDEFEKMGKEDRGAIHEALEQQTISVAKAGIVTSLSAKTTVLAAANPKYGRFDPYRSIAEQIELDAAILSRFDLKFPIQDVASKEHDTALAEHILKSYVDRSSVSPIYEPIFLRKYIAYARKNLQPILGKDTLKMLKDFYVDWREKYADTETGSVSLTPRQLEALSRLAEASAKIRLSKKVEAQDVERATRLLEVSLRALGTDKETGKIDIDRIETGISSQQRSRIHILLDIITELEGRIGKRIPAEEITEAAKEKGINMTDLESLLNKLKQKGDLYEPKPGYLQRA